MSTHTLTAVLAHLRNPACSYWLASARMRLTSRERPADDAMWVRGALRIAMATPKN